MKFCKEEFKQGVKDNLKTLFRRSIEDATQVQLFQAVAFAVPYLQGILSGYDGMGYAEKLQKQGITARSVSAG